jgi:hypothetical protein
MKRPKNLPKVPKVAFSHIGPVPVSHEDLNGERLFGQFRGTERRIRVHEDLPAAAGWQTYWHEVGHLILHDAGISPELRSAMEERVVDAFGLYMTAAMSAGFIKVVP